MFMTETKKNESKGGIPMTLQIWEFDNIILGFRILIKQFYLK